VFVRKRLASGIVASAFAAASLLVWVTGESAQAADRTDASPQRTCAPPGYLTSQSARYIGNPATREYGRAGGTLSIAQDTTRTISGTLQTTVSADAGVIFAKVSTSVGISVGWVEMGSHGYQISWRYGSYNSSCNFVTSRSGSLSGVTSNVEFTHS
jgi:hypothetical protein